jgi:asparagine synthase (glutamine-hydrolysing)
MCGISGLFYYDRNQRPDTGVLDRMRAVSNHRGPDDHGLYTDGPAGLAFNRLSIIDLSGGHQPMSNEDGTVWIVFNGEIYNFAELRDDLLARGHRFQTRSDTETIVHAWEEYGEEAVGKLHGMFAFAIWDSRRRVLFGARDRLGIKPFYYCSDQERFAFASEMKSLLQVPGTSRDVNTEAVGEFLLRRYVVAPHTMLRGISKLEPGHTVLVTERGVQVKRYWQPPLDEDTHISEAEAIEQAGTLLESAVRSHLVSDVPLGAFLSGGLDSSCVVGLMAKLGVRDIKTFSIGYDSPESELDYARIVADHFHTDHHELRLSPVEFSDTLPKIVWYMDEPVGDPASIPLYYLSHFARQKVTVALSGEGSDEIFAGYPIYKRMLQFEAFNRIPLAGSAGWILSKAAGDTKIRKYADMLGKPLEWRYGGVGGLFSRAQAARMSVSKGRTLDGVSAAYAKCGGASVLGRMSYVDLTTWLPDDLLVKADRMTMANSLELRVPFLDHRLVEFATRLPRRLRMRGGVTKYLLKKWAAPLLPAQIINRPKAGFSVPTKSWFRGDLAGYARETLLARDSASLQFLSAVEIERLLEAHRFEDRSEQIYSLLVFTHWCRNVADLRPREVESPHVVTA